MKSKWLREENDYSWESRVGRENSKVKFQDDSNSNFEDVTEGGEIVGW